MGGHSLCLHCKDHKPKSKSYYSCLDVSTAWWSFVSLSVQQIQKQPLKCWTFVLSRTFVMPSSSLHGDSVHENLLLLSWLVCHRKILFSSFNSQKRETGLWWWGKNAVIVGITVFKLQIKCWRLFPDGRWSAFLMGGGLVSLRISYFPTRHDIWRFCCALMLTWISSSWDFKAVIHQGNL